MFKILLPYGTRMSGNPDSPRALRGDALLTVALVRVQPHPREVGRPVWTSGPRTPDFLLG